MRAHATMILDTDRVMQIIGKQEKEVRFSPHFPSHDPLRLPRAYVMEQMERCVALSRLSTGRLAGQSQIGTYTSPPNATEGQDRQGVGAGFCGCFGVVLHRQWLICYSKLMGIVLGIGRSGRICISRVYLRSESGVLVPPMFSLFAFHARYRK